MVLQARPAARDDLGLYIYDSFTLRVQFLAHFLHFPQAHNRMTLLPTAHNIHELRHRNRAVAVRFSNRRPDALLRDSLHIGICR